MSNLNDIFIEGANAPDWVTLESCPHPVFSREAKAWCDGLISRTKIPSELSKDDDAK